MWKYGKGNGTQILEITNFPNVGDGEISSCQKRVILESNICMFDHTCYTYGGSYYISYVTNVRQMMIYSVSMQKIWPRQCGKWKNWLKMQVDLSIT